MANLSRRTIAKVETWINKQKTSKLRKMLEDDWVVGYEARDIEDWTDEEVRDTMMSDIKTGDDQVETILESIGIEPEYSDEAEDEQDYEEGEDADDFDDEEE